MQDLSNLEKIIGINFKNKDLLLQAVIHRSYLNEHPKFRLGDNERLEFLGDAVLEIIITEKLFKAFPNNPEGDLTNWRASLVNAKILGQIADNLKFGDFLLLSRGEANDRNTKARMDILANCFEAVVGAIYLDKGIKSAETFVNRVVWSQINYILDQKLYIDPKSYFQEKSQEHLGITPSYKVLKEIGPAHDKFFEVGVFIENEMIAQGNGKSKQDAQVMAADEALKVKGWK